MDRKRLNTLRTELEAMRGNPQKARDVANLAEALGRKREDRGKEPTWVSEEFDLPNLTIPMHPGDLKRRTLNSILNQLEDDLIAWEQKLDYEDNYAKFLRIERQKRGLV